MFVTVGEEKKIFKGTEGPWQLARTEAPSVRCWLATACGQYMSGVTGAGREGEGLGNGMVEPAAGVNQSHHDFERNPRLP